MRSSKRIPDLKKILYIANIRLPTEKAHGAQIMKACEAFVSVGLDLELVVTNRKSTIHEDPFAYYGIKTRFALRRLLTLDTLRWGSVGYIFESVVFALSALFYAQKNHFDIFYGRDEIVLAIISFFTKKKIFWESHDGAWNIWAKYLVTRAQGCIVVTKSAVDFYKEHGVSPSRLLAVPNGIDLDAFQSPESQEDARKRLGLPIDKKIALYIGRLDGWKGTDTLLDASRELPTDMVVAIIGGEKEQIEELRPRYPQVLFLGYRPFRELRDNQAAGDVLVLPNTAKNTTSTRFTSPMKLFSYMAAGKPIVASDLPSIREIVSEQMAIFFEPDNALSLAHAIKTALGDPALAKGVADKAQSQIARYSWHARAESIRRFIEHV